MKKILLMFLILILSSVTLCAFASPGDIAGQYYYTDINVYLNGEPIDSINIGGETLISAEDMYYYSFQVYWHEDTRILEIYPVANAVNGVPPPVIVPDGIIPGTIRGNYYETDIVTTLDSKPITAYNVGGRTYIHAEEMRSFGYLVDWSETDRTLLITSPERAGYIYSFPLVYGTKKEVQGIGSASVSYKDGKVFGQGDADYFNLHFGLEKDGSYHLALQFYQNEGLFYSDILQDRLRPLACLGYGVETKTSPEELYDDVSSVIKLSVNGYEADKIEVWSGAGSGHRDFYIITKDLPRFKKSEISEIKLSIGNPEGAEYEISLPEYVIPFTTEFAQSLKKYELDFLVTNYQTETHILYFMRESPSLGVVIDRLYLVDNETKEVSNDILEAVRAFEGFSEDKINPFSFKTIKGYDDRIYFSCSSSQKTGDFYVNVKTKEVFNIAEHNK